MTQPRFSFAPPEVSNASPEAIDLCAEAGMPLDEWQRIALRLMLGERADGSWSSFEFGLDVARQNGKGGVLEGRKLAGLFLFGERRIIYSAHQADTAHEAFLRMRNLIDGTAWLSARIRKINSGRGTQRIETMTGQVLSYRTRTSGGGRGFSAGTVILDEAQELVAAEIAAIMPVVSAQPNPQLIYAGTVKAGALVFRGVVERGRQQIGTRLGYAEWSAPDDAESDDEAAAVAANPALGIRITAEYVRNELAAFRAAGAEQQWREERLGIWPAVDQVGAVIPLAPWAAGRDTGWKPTIAERILVGVAVSIDRAWASVGVAARRPDGSTYVEVIKHEQGLEWLLPWLVGFAERRTPAAVVVDQAGPAATLIAAMTTAGLTVRVTDTSAYKSACAGFVDDVKAGRIAHIGQQPLDAAAAGVKEHRVGDAWVYARRDSGVLIAPLEAVTLARWGLVTPTTTKEFFMLNLNDYAEDQPEDSDDTLPADEPTQFGRARGGFVVVRPGGTS